VRDESHAAALFDIATGLRRNVRSLRADDRSPAPIGTDGWMWIGRDGLQAQRAGESKPRIVEARKTWGMLAPDPRGTRVAMSRSPLVDTTVIRILTVATGRMDTVFLRKRQPSQRWPVMGWLNDGSLMLAIDTASNGGVGLSAWYAFYRI